MASACAAGTRTTQLISEADQFLLIREMHHRLANTLAIVASVLRREFPASLSTAALQRSLARCEARIVAFGNLNRALAVGGTDEQISLTDYVERLCEALSDALLGPLGVRCEVFADDVEFPADRSERVGLAISELVTNAAKHGFDERKEGVVRVELLKRNESLICTVADNGIGGKDGPLGTGSRIVERLVGALGGTLVRTARCDGTAVTVTWKI